MKLNVKESLKLLMPNFYSVVLFGFLTHHVETISYSKQSYASGDQEFDPGSHRVPVTSLIVNGVQSTFHAFYVRLARQHNGELKWFCGAILFSDRWVLTSAKCVRNINSTYRW